MEIAVPTGTCSPSQRLDGTKVPGANSDGSDPDLLDRDSPLGSPELHSHIRREMLAHGIDNLLPVIGFARIVFQHQLG